MDDLVMSLAAYWQNNSTSGVSVFCATGTNSKLEQAATIAGTIDKSVRHML